MKNLSVGWCCQEVNLLLPEFNMLWGCLLFLLPLGTDFISRVRLTQREKEQTHTNVSPFFPNSLFSFHIYLLLFTFLICLVLYNFHFLAVSPSCSLGSSLVWPFCLSAVFPSPMLASSSSPSHLLLVPLVPCFHSSSPALCRIPRPGPSESLQQHYSKSNHR